MPSLNTDFQNIDPYYKDEVTAGIEWQVHANWAFKARGMYWKLDDLFWSTQQIAANGAIFTSVQNFPRGRA